MKKLSTMLAFTLFCLIMPVLMAHAVAQTDAQAELSGKSSPVKIKIDTGDQNERLSNIVEGIGGIFGERVKAELELELSNLSQAERGELDVAIADLFDEDDITIRSSGISAAESFIAIIAICLTLGLPVIILLLVFIFGQRKRRQMMELAGMYISADKPMPDQLMSKIGGMSSEQRYSSGIRLVLIGLALVAFFGANAGLGAATMGLIPLAIGLARVIYWRHEKSLHKEQDQLMNLDQN